MTEWKTGRKKHIRMHVRRQKKNSAAWYDRNAASQKKWKDDTWHAHDTPNKTEPDNHSIFSSLSSSFFLPLPPSSLFIHIKHHFYFTIYFCQSCAWLFFISRYPDILFHSNVLVLVSSRIFDFVLYVSTLPCACEQGVRVWLKCCAYPISYYY